MSDLEKTLTLDPYMNEVIGWLLVFLFTSLVGIIVWMAKGVYNEIKEVSRKQDINHNQVSTMENNLSHVKNDLDSVLRDFPNLLTKTTLLETILVDIKSDMGGIKKDHLEFNRRLQQVELDSALHKQWIELKGNNGSD